MVPGWKRTGFRFESRARLRNRRILANQSKARCRTSRDSLRRDRMEGPPGIFPRRKASGLLILSGTNLASAVAHSSEWGRRVSHFLWRLRQREPAMVARWQVHRLYL